LAATAGFSSFTDSRLRAGFVGGGVEWMFFPNWSLKAEALHYDLGTSRVSGFLQQAVAGGGAIIANTSPVSSWRNDRHHRPRRPELPPPLV
jgi:outer membrane immunogenic protein